MAVPLENVYYLLCYAWDRLEAGELARVGAVPGDRVENLLGKVLDEGVASLIRRGLDRGYLARDEIERRLRGKILISETVNRLLLQRGRVACHRDDLSYDVPHNRVLKAGMRGLIALPTLDAEIRARLRDHCRRMHEVSDIDLTPEAFRVVRLHRNIARYGFLVGIVQLIARSLLPKDAAGRRGFRPFTASEQEMGLLFEAFVRNFLRREQDEFRVSRPKVPWDLDLERSSDTVWLPEMQTDVVLTSDKSRIVIETKYYAMPYQARMERRKLISGHLYQLHAYVSQLRADDGRMPLGVLLYARVGEERKLEYQIARRSILIRTLNLDQSWQLVRRDLLALARELGSSRYAGSAFDDVCEGTR